MSLLAILGLRRPPMEEFDYEPRPSRLRASRRQELKRNARYAPMQTRRLPRELHEEPAPATSTRGEVALKWTIVAISGSLALLGAWGMWTGV